MRSGGASGPTGAINPESRKEVSPFPSFSWRRPVYRSLAISPGLSRVALDEGELPPLHATHSDRAGACRHGVELPHLWPRDTTAGCGSIFREIRRRMDTEIDPSSSLSPGIRALRVLRLAAVQEGR